ncbi:MAG: family 1 glycosylhydrolase [Candidatus Thorarchaeota archaeon]
MRRLNKAVPFFLILVILMFVPSGISQEEEGILYEGDDVLLQAGNSQPKFQFVPSSLFQEVVDIRMGACFYSSNTYNDLPGLHTWMPNIKELGIWRFDTCVDENEPPINWDYINEEEFPEEYDQFIDELNENGVTVNYMLHFWDKIGHANGSELSTPRFQSEEQIQDFLNYTRFVVSHFKDRVQYYTIWSEPDACPGIKCIEVEDYINLVNRTVPVIHEENPEAKISIAPNVLFFAQDYLSTILESDIMTMVDVIQWHGIYSVIPNDPFYGDYYYQYPAIVEGIRQTAVAHGFDGECWATEVGYSTETDKQGAKYASRFLIKHLGMDMGVAMGDLRYDNLEIRPWEQRALGNLYKILAGTKSTSLDVEFENEPTNAVATSFELPNGDSVFALWIDGEAVEDDPGVKTTLTFPSQSAQKVVVIDVLNGFEQELFKRMENGDLIIRNIYLKDYPIILLINNGTSAITSQDQFPLMQLSIIVGVPVVVVGALVFWKKHTVRRSTL